MRNRMTLKSALVFILLFIGALLPMPSPAYVVDKIEAVVNGAVITRGEVDRLARDEAFRRGITASEDLKKLRKEVLGSLIDRKLLSDEAGKFKLVEVTDEEVERAFESVKGKYGSADAFVHALKDDEITVEELKEDLKEQLLVMKYVDRRLKFFVRVTLDDEKKYYSENAGKFGDKSFSDAHEEIYSLLVEQETDKKLKEYLRDLRAKSDIITMDEGPDDIIVK